jgi:hypothetical protein
MHADHQRLLARAERTFAGRSVEQTVSRTRAIVGVKTLPAAETDAQSALDKLREGQEPAPIEMAALEFMVRLMRPAVLCHGGAIEPLPEYNDYNAALIAQWDAFRQMAGPLLYSIGRIDRVQGSPVGTGFLVATDVLVTNRHVVHDLTFGTDAIGPGQGEVRFGQEYGTPDAEAAVPILGLIAFEAALDVALLKIEPTAKPVLRFEGQPAPVSTSVAAIGYPADDSKRNPAFIPAVYDGKFGVKRVSPGEVIDGASDLLYHDCSTLGGNSGSPILALASGKLVGVHKSGTFMYRNKAAAGVRVKAFVEQHVG